MVEKVSLHFSLDRMDGVYADQKELAWNPDDGVHTWF